MKKNKWKVSFRKQGNTVVAIFPERKVGNNMYAYIANYGWNEVSPTIYDNTEPANKVEYAPLMKILQGYMNLKIVTDREED